MFFPSVLIPLIAVSLRLVQLFVRCILQLHTMQQNVSSFFLIFCWQVSHTDSRNQWSFHDFVSYLFGEDSESKDSKSTLSYILM